MDRGKVFHSLADLAQLQTGQPAQASGKAGEPGKVRHDGKGKSVRVMLDDKGRKGKTVTVVAGLQHNPETMEKLARILKQHCGAGGTVREGMIEIQGDQRDRVAGKLQEMNYTVK